MRKKCQFSNGKHTCIFGCWDAEKIESGYMQENIAFRHNSQSFNHTIL